MKCHAHPQDTAKRSCHACLHPLCGACSHDVMGTFFCSDCLTERLTLGEDRRPRPRTPRLKLPWLAALLSFFLPGLGHVYVGLVTRGLAHFVILIVLARLSDLAGALEPLAVLALVAYYFWQIFDAVGAARDVNRLGRLPDPEEAKAMGRGPLPGADGGSRWLGYGVAGAGVLILMQNFGLAGWFDGFVSLAWPFALIGVGAWLLHRSKREQEEARRADRLDLEAPDAEPWEETP